MGDEDLRIANRGSTTTRALLSAALVLPTVLIWDLRNMAGDWSVEALQTWSLAWTAVLGGYFVVVVAVLARTSARRSPAVIMGIAATVLDVGGSAMFLFAPESSVVRWTYWILTVVTLVLFVAAWGIARRSTPKWLIGMAPTLVIAVVIASLYGSAWLYDTAGSAWIVYWAVWVGGFMAGCVICWSFDALGRSARPAPGVEAPAHGLAPVTHPIAPQSNTMAIAALVSALVLAPLGIVFGHVALRQIKTSGDGGRGLAIAGLVIGYVVTVLLALSLILVVVYFSAMISSLDDVSNAAPVSQGIPG